MQDHERPELLFAGTEFGVFFSVSGGGRWIKLEGGVPNIPFRDLAIQKRENDLVGATFGRSFYILDDYSPLRQVSEQMLDQEAKLFAVKDAWWYVEKRPLGRGQKATQGADFFTAPNPPFGAVFTYYLRDGLETRKAKRREREKEIAKEGGDTPYPGWDALRAEAREEDPAMLLTVRDAAGAVVRRIEGPAKPGFHRVAWDLRYPTPEAWSPEPPNFFRRPTGMLVAPGTYSVSLAQRHDGEVADLGQSQTFEVKPLRDPVLPGMAPAEMVAALREVADLQRAVSAAGAAIGETEKRLGAIKEVLMRSTVSDSSLDDEARALAGRLADLKEALEGNEQQDAIGEPTPPSVSRRLFTVAMGNRLSAYGPTPHHLESFRIAEEEFVAIREGLNRIVRIDLPALEAKLEAAGVPWTPGRGVPE